MLNIWQNGQKKKQPLLSIIKKKSKFNNSSEWIIIGYIYLRIWKRKKVQMVKEKEDKQLELLEYQASSNSPIKEESNLKEYIKRTKKV